ncbi:MULTISPECIES: hypothetical protein [Paracoccus]|uniref:hypothetical protein n=1 Tax=Paracoccus TaxID=265 RepID=UPI001F05C380|nr:MULTISPECIES: hypothetical protein [Paracoccus]
MAANTPLLHRAYDQLADPGHWLAPQGLGGFPIRFPSPIAPATMAGTWTWASTTARISWSGGSMSKAGAARY